MDEVHIKPNTGKNMRLLDDESQHCGLHIGFGMLGEEAFLGGYLGHDQLNQLIEGCQQWLKENPKKVEGWQNVYPPAGKETRIGNVWPTRDEADERCFPERLACIPVSYHIGEGLEATQGEE